MFINGIDKKGWAGLSGQSGKCPSGRLVFRPFKYDLQ